MSFRRPDKILVHSLVAVLVLYCLPAKALKVISREKSPVVKKQSLDTRIDFNYTDDKGNTWDYKGNINAKSKVLTVHVGLKLKDTTNRPMVRTYIIDLEEIHQYSDIDVFGCYYENFTTDLLDDGQTLETGVALCPLSETKIAFKTHTSLDGEEQPLSLAHGYIKVNSTKQEKPEE